MHWNCYDMHTFPNLFLIA